MAETFHGYIDTTQDVLLIFEGCRRGLLPRVNRRLQEKERKLIRSGSVFVFDERESGVKRWTDGLVWSPSRILGNFLIYRELEKRNGEKRMSISDHRQRSYSMDVSSTVAAAGRGYLPDRVKEKRLVGSLSEVYNFRPDGLIKKTMSIVVNGSTQHLISYYHPQDIIENKLRTPSSVPELTSLEISPELLVKQNFRIPPFVEPAFDQPTDTGPTAGLPIRHHPNNNQQQYRPQPSQKYPYQESAMTVRNAHQNDSTSATTANTGSPLRSMSAGSLNSLRQESLLYTDQHSTTIDGLMGYDSYNNNNNTPSGNSQNDKSSRMYPLYFQQQQQQQQPQQPQQQQQQQQDHNQSRQQTHIQQQMHSYSPNHTAPMRNSNNVPSAYSLTPSPNGVHYDQHPQNPYHEQQRYSTSPNPQLGHLLNPVHPLNSTTSNATAPLVHNDTTATTTTTSTGTSHDMQVKMESIDQPIFYGNRASPLSTSHNTSRLL